ncbi:isochorismatase family protein [Streptomyces sp. tea 10]|nr:isochorismatase family protein [Streptomyces sp. tea 10]
MKTNPVTNRGPAPPPPGSGISEFRSVCTVGWVLTMASDIDVLVRFGRALADPIRCRILLVLREAPARRRALAICGVTSEIVVLHTALDAIAAGYEVSVLLDACGGLSPRTEQAAFRRIEAAGGRITSVASFATDLVRDFTTPTGQEVISALHGLMQQLAAEPAR